MRTKPALAAGITIAVLSSGLSWWIGARVQSPTEAAASAAPPPLAPITAPVERRVLEDRLVLRGTVRARAEVAISVDAAPRASGRAVVTKLPLRDGDLVPEGKVLLEISGRPVFALRGSIPAYRDLEPGMRGEDVAQLQTALARMGYAIWDRRGVFRSWTARAVRRFYHLRGYEPPEPPTEPTAADAASERAAPPTGGQPAPPEAANTQASRGRSAGSPGSLVVPYTELAYLQRLPARVTAVRTAIGRPPEGKLLTLAESAPVVQAGLTAEAAALVKVGATATVETDAGDARFRARVATVEPRSGGEAVAPEGGVDDQSTTDQGGDQGGDAADAFLVRMVTRKPIAPSLLRHDVQVTIPITSSRGKVLAVPLAAIWTGADGTERVSRLNEDGREETIVVKPGLSAGGYVAVRASSVKLEPDDLVIVGR